MRFLILLVLIFNFSCSKSKIEQKIDLDSQKTIELINQILKDKKDTYLSSSCIFENSSYFSNLDFSDYGMNANKYLSIKDSSHYQLQKKLCRDFNITNKIIPNKNIITERKFKSFQSKREFWKWDKFNCIEGFCTILKPFFNEEYDLAYITISKKIFEYNYNSQTLLYEFKNGKWTEKEIIKQIIS